jgi:hypothetical protein
LSQIVEMNLEIRKSFNMYKETMLFAKLGFATDAGVMWSGGWLFAVHRVKDEQ